MIETLKFALGAIVVVAVLWLALTRLGRFLSWVERSEIARQKAEAAEEAALKKGVAVRRRRARPRSWRRRSPRAFRPTMWSPSRRRSPPTVSGSSISTMLRPGTPGRRKAAGCTRRRIAGL